MKKPKRTNKACKYFPCHSKLQDCTFCYCPFYPCEDKKRGKYLAPPHEKIWSCKNCSWIHQTKIVDKIFDLIKKSGFEL